MFTLADSNVSATHSIHFSSRPLESPQFRRFPPSPKSLTTKETKPIKRRPTLQSKKVLSVYYHNILHDILLTEVLTQTDVEDNSMIVDGHFEVIQSDLDASVFVSGGEYFELLIQEEKNLPPFESLDPNYSCEKLG